MLLPPSCTICGLPLPSAAWPACAACRAGLRDGPPLRRLLVAGDEPVLPAWGGRASGRDLVELIGAWKYGGARRVAPLAVRMARRAARRAVATDGPVDLLVPLPLHHGRERRRGFNQAAVLAAGIASELCVPVEVSLLRRRRATAQQARIPADDPRRALNVSGAFVAAAAAGGTPRRIGLVDDLVTSGATALAAAAALRQGGWEVGWIVCCGLRQPVRGTP